MTLKNNRHARLQLDAPAPTFIGTYDRSAKQALWRDAVIRLRCFCVLALSASGCFSAAADHPWKRHVIDESFRGADGVRLADFDGDGLQDVVTGWEQSGIVRLYLHPGHERATEAWPAVTVGKAGSPEDAVPLDLDGDGDLDVVSCHEGKTRQVYVHHNAAGKERPSLMRRGNWTSSAFEQIDGQMWMFAEPIWLRHDRRGLIVGSKGHDGSITLLIAPRQQAANLDLWQVVRIRDAGWIMTLKSLDMDGDGDQDLLFSDRKGDQRGVGWLEQPDRSASEPWREHPIGGSDYEVMFVDAMRNRVLVSTRDSVCVDFVRQKNHEWTAMTFANPSGVPFGKAIKQFANEMIVLTANTAADKQANPKRPGVWLRYPDQTWQAIDPTPAIKPDRIECVDLDGDGDLDVMTCEERKNLGVIWYENPER